ncbi:DinB family protein [Eudoraea adriatica]|uniref:DinB family protein n=1 Tax=Eudoraea adriatica TaxID=446681 RepID=UPI000368777B|nr:hypothetical protein [Eudoraea adriatica]
MKIKNTLMALFLITVMNAQEKNPQDIPYYQIPDYPDSYTPGTVVARMIDGLGFRYFWATEGLNAEDLAYKPSESNRTIDETLDHIYNLSRVVYNSAIKEINDRTQPGEKPLSFQEKRKRTLLNFKKASEILGNAEDLNEHPIIFKTKSGTFNNPFWNQINGPIEDAVWHCGQIVALRRAAGNPIDPKVNVFAGERRSE